MDLIRNFTHFSSIQPNISLFNLYNTLFVGEFVVSHQAQFLDEMGDYVRSGRVVYKEDRVKGLAEAPHAFRAMLTGSNFGKMLVEVQPGY